jgi:hypothetical protein
VELDDAEGIERFVREGGQVLVVAEPRLERVRRATAVEVRFRARSGNRALLVVVPVRAQTRDEPGLACPGRKASARLVLRPNAGASRQGGPPDGRDR